MEQVIAFLNTYYLVIARFLFVIYAVIILIQLKRCMFHRSETTKVLAVLNVEDGAIRLPLTHYETTIGRSKACDVVVPLPVMSRQHAVLSMEENGMWKISDTNSNGGISVNGEDLEQDSMISVGDEISMAGVKMRRGFGGKGMAGVPMGTVSPQIPPQGAEAGISECGAGRAEPVSGIGVFAALYHAAGKIYAVPCDMLCCIADPAVGI